MTLLAGAWLHEDTRLFVVAFSQRTVDDCECWLLEMRNTFGAFCILIARWTGDSDLQQLLRTTTNHTWQLKGLATQMWLYEWVPTFALHPEGMTTNFRKGSSKG